MKRLILLAAAMAAIFAYTAIPAHAGSGGGEHCTEPPVLECRGGGGGGGEGSGGGGGGNSYQDIETRGFSFRGGLGFGGSGEGDGFGRYCYGNYFTHETVCHGHTPAL